MAVGHKNFKHQTAQLVAVAPSALEKLALAEGPMRLKFAHSSSFSTGGTTSGSPLFPANNLPLIAMNWL
jgi:hypothetical protein